MKHLDTTRFLSACRKAVSLFLPSIAETNFVLSAQGFAGVMGYSILYVCGDGKVRDAVDIDEISDLLFDFWDTCSAKGKEFEWTRMEAVIDKDSAKFEFIAESEMDENINEFADYRPELIMKYFGDVEYEFI